MQYRQITSGERYAIAALRKQRLSIRAIARDLGRAPSTISREVARNRRADGGYRAFTACEHTSARRRRSRRNTHFGAAEWALVEELIALDWSPEQVAGWLRRHERLAISYETIYLYVWRDKHAGGKIWRHMRQAGKRRRKRYGAYDSRGRSPRTGSWRRPDRTVRSLPVASPPPATGARACRPLLWASWNAGFRHDCCPCSASQTSWIAS